jgi:hypothetical protein
MFIIAHRANLNGPNKLLENSPEQIQLCLAKNYNCEIDVWLVNNKLFLGHDAPQYEIELLFILQNRSKLWCHCKHLESFEFLLKYKEINCFYHETDAYILTSHGYVWTYPGKKLSDDNGIVVMPEWNPDIKYDKNKICGICTDYVENVGMFFK